MKLKTTETPIMSGGNLKMKGFQIAASAKAFRILSSSLYKNKIRAIIRELSCNAVDGHIAGGNKETFDVQLPGMLDPQFRIRDYGCGMDDDTIMNLYTTYFASTKSDSNDFIGALGLGSKSPFSYTDSFTVTAFYNGMRRMYSAFIKDGEPTITKVSEAETKEPNGIEITVPVNPNDISRWKEEARYVFSSFGEIRPKVLGNMPIEFMPYDKPEFEVKNSVHGAGVFAIMGNIVYPLPGDMWTNTMINLSMQGQNSWSRSGQSAYYIRFELGEVDITPSREELSFDDDTIAAIKARINKADVRLSKSLIDEVATFDNVRELRRHINKKYNSYYWNHVSSKPEFLMKDGKSVADTEEIVTHWKHPEYKVTKADMKDPTKSITSTVDVSFMRYDMSLTSPRGKRLDSWQCQRLADYGNDHINIFINDMKSSAIRTMKGIHKLNGWKGHYVIAVEGEHADKVIAEVKKHWKDTEYNIHFSSKSDDARKAMPTAKKATVVKTPNTVKLTMTDTTPVALYAEDIKKLSGYWIPMYQNEYVSSEARGRTMCSIASIRLFMKHRNLKEVPVIKSSHWEQVKKNDKMSEVWDEMLKLVIELESKLTIDIFPYDTTANGIVAGLRRHPDLVHVADKISKKNPATELHALFRDILRQNLYKFENLPTYKANEKKLKEMLTKFDELTKIADKKGREALDEFLENNKLITFYLQRSYGTIEESFAKEIVSLIKL